MTWPPSSMFFGIEAGFSVGSGLGGRDDRGFAGHITAWAAGSAIASCAQATDLQGTTVMSRAAGSARPGAAVMVSDPLTKLG